MHSLKSISIEGESMLKVKKWNFPTYDEWDSNGRAWESKVGSYTCAIRAFGGGEDNTTYKCAIAAKDNPINIYVRTAVEYIGDIENNDIEGLKAWYNGVVESTNIQWERYITLSYFEESV